jgi:hypothetical protein
MRAKWHLGLALQLLIDRSEQRFFQQRRRGKNMSYSQFQNFKHLRSLLTQLRDFGLNPIEWRMVPETQGKDVIYLQNRSDEDFCLVGALGDVAATPRISSLSVLSL